MINIGDLVLITDSMRSKLYTSPIYQQYGIVLNIDPDDYGNLEGAEILLCNQEVVYCFPDEIKICSHIS